MFSWRDQFVFGVFVMFYSMRVIHLYSFGVRVVLWGASGCGGVSLGGSVVQHGADVLKNIPDDRYAFVSVQYIVL
jgi:hypothetical protein